MPGGLTWHMVGNGSCARAGCSSARRTVAALDPRASATRRFSVPKGPCAQLVSTWTRSTCIGTTARPMCVLFECMLGALCSATIHQTAC